MCLSRRRRCNFSTSPGPIPDLPTVQKSHRRLARHFQYECECEWSATARCTPGSRWSSFARPLPSLRRATSKTAALPNDARPAVWSHADGLTGPASILLHMYNVTSLTSCSANLTALHRDLNSTPLLTCASCDTFPSVAARRSSVSYPVLPTPHPPCALPDLTLRIRPWQPTLNKLAQETLPSLTILTGPQVRNPLPKFR
ncbi:hypothetical protein IWZ03DRAFT_48973 [Phyllosticta citriasiana]|uniref:Uncharacterized protein n=1 Tax=Phyllosticta citriasiana TaxID=595635 RepID=A0ABR1KBZ9_9PEZI